MLHTAMLVSRGLITDIPLYNGTGRRTAHCPRSHLRVVIRALAWETAVAGHAVQFRDA
jgi:hypothetical protein